MKQAPHPAHPAQVLAGLLLAVAAVSISWALDHAADLELGTQGTAVLVAVLGLAYRWVRGLSGKEPPP